MDTMIANPPDQERAAIVRFVDTFQSVLERADAAETKADAPAHACLIAPGEEPIEIPEAIYGVLRDVARILKAGDAIRIESLHKRLTTTQAADLLGVSRQYLTRIIDRNEIPCERVNRHRRLLLGDVIAYRDARKDQRRRAVAAVVAGSAELGAYD